MTRRLHVGQRVSRVAPLLVLSGCVLLAERSLDERYGAADPTRFDASAAASGGPSFRLDVQPILDHRCVVCHACYDAPCQLDLGAWEGVARGASKDKVYQSARLLEAPTSRLFQDAQTASQWRAQGFAPVLNERAATREANLAASVLYRMLDLKRAHPLPGDAVLPGSFDFSVDRAQQCPRIEEFDRFARDFPLWGMPYGLPGLSESETSTLTEWLAHGASSESAAPLPAELTRQVEGWEAFLNGDSPKQRLMSRYLFEHLFLAHLSFMSDPDRWFRLVRSLTPPGEPIAGVFTRRPYDDPGTERVFYRLEPERRTLVVKTHMPYRLGPERMARWRALFLEPEYAVDVLPSYAPEVAANPFVAFRALPVSARYRFMLDEAQYIIMGFIKGPVCRGQVAVDVIEDHFWVFFVDPAKDPLGEDPEFLARESHNLQLPSESGSNAAVLSNWRKYARLENRYLEAKSQHLEQKLDGPHEIGLPLIWDGDGHNPNAGLTIFRHFDSASVVRGLVGAPPKTAWLIGYPLFERIHYLLVAGFDVYGNVGHQLNSRLYMDFLRMEGESNFLDLLPRAARIPVRDYWYRDASDEVKDQVYGGPAHFDRESGIAYRTDDPQHELYGLLQTRLAPVLGTRFDLSSVGDPALERDLRALGAVQGASLAWLPEVAFLRVDEAQRPARYFSLIRNTGHSNVSRVFTEGHAILPAEHTLTVVPGFIGSYPNAFYAVARADLPALTESIRALSSDGDYRALADRFAIRRSNPEFWQHSDALHEAYARMAPAEAALFDYNRLENR